MNKIEMLIKLVNANGSLSLKELIELSGLKHPQVVGCIKSLASKGVAYNKENRVFSVSEVLAQVKEQAIDKAALVKDLISGVLRSSRQDLDNEWLFAIVGSSASRSGFNVSRDEFNEAIAELV